MIYINVLFWYFTEDKAGVAMNFTLKKAVTTVVIFLALTFSAALSYASDDEEYIRIGLFFKDSAAGVNSAVASFSVSSDKGLSVGFYDGRDFEELYEEEDSETFTIRKDAYYVINNGVFSEYNPSAQNNPGENRIGPFHIRLGRDYEDFDSVEKEIRSIKKKGIDAFPVYADEWQIWTGFYTDRTSAEEDIKKIKKKLDDGTYKVVEPSDSRVVIFSNDGDVKLMFESDENFLRVMPLAKKNQQVIKVNGVRYRGGIEVRRIKGSDMTVINVLPLEHYLYGVVPAEIEASSHPEALKAQAVVARTYTLNNLGKHGNLGFDLCNTTHCQVYKGVSAEADSTNEAVDDTEGETVMYKGERAQVFYFSSSGGRTEDVENVWSTPLPYLRSVEDKYESGKSTNYIWESTYSAAKIKEIMLERGYDLGDIVSVKITKTAPSGRVTELVIKGTKGERVYTKSGCRSVFRTLCSQWYTITTDADVSVKAGDGENVKTTLAGSKVITAGGVKTLDAGGKPLIVVGAKNSKRSVSATPQVYTFSGRGWGHGVGMSQEGAKGMANAGFKYDEILRHYFQGTTIE